MSVVFKYLRLPEPDLDAVLASEAEADRLWDRLVEEYSWDLPESSELGIADADTLWDAIHYVLDPERRAGRTDSGSRAAQAVRGAEPFSEPRGFGWIGYSRPLQVRAIAAGLADVDILSLAAPLADELGAADRRDAIYRSGEPRFIAHWFEPMRALYQEAASRSQAVLVFQ